VTAGKRLVGDLIEDELALRCERMALGKQNIPGRICEGLDNKVLIWRRREQQLDIDSAPLEISQAARGVEVTYLHLHVGPRFHEAAQNGPYERLDARKQSEDEVAFRAQPRPESALCLFGGCQRNSSLLVEGGSGGCEADAASMAFKELKS
jgi:hypothetical protein